MSLSTVTPADICIYIYIYIYKLIHDTRVKTSPVDSTPTSVIKACPAVFSQLVAHLTNCSFTQGCFLDRFKRAQVTTANEGMSSQKNTSKLPTYCIFKHKIVKRLALLGLRQRSVGSQSLNPAQSAYVYVVARNSIETTLLRTSVFAHRNLDRGEATMLEAVDISAAFDVVVHSTLLCNVTCVFI